MGLFKTLQEFQFFVVLFYLIRFLHQADAYRFNQNPFRDFKASNNNNPNRESETLDSNSYRHFARLDNEGKYQLEWLVDWKTKRVIFNVTVETRGYVGFGLSKQGKMAGADIVIGGVGSDGKSYFTDRHALGNQYPTLDQSQDWTLHSAQETATHTFLTFSRPFDTCDKNDIPINDDTLSILWAYGERDNPVEYHFGNRGSYNVHLLDPDLTPRIIQQTNSTTSLPPQFRNTQVWTITSQLQLPPKKTTYWCKFQKLSLPRKNHGVGYIFKMNVGNYSHMHHLLLFRCSPPPNVNPSTLYEPFLNHPGEECYSTPTHTGVLPTQYCFEITFGHAIGGRPTFFPDHVGVPIGESPNEYYLLQVHYDNPELRADIQTEIQIDVFHTPQLRQNDGGILSIGHQIPGSPGSLLIPPRSLDHRILGHCSTTCSQRMFPQDGIKVFGVLLHSHDAGRQLRMQLFRNNRELPWVMNDDNYIFSFQTVRFLRKEVTILPGDQVTARCVYDTTIRNTTTVGGYATEQEMCQAFVLYYTRLRNYPVCRSEIISQDYRSRYLGTTGNFTWDPSQLEFVASAPPHLAGLTVSQISDSRFVNWSADLREQLQRDHIFYPQVAICPSTAIPPQLQPSQPHFVSVPVQAARYQPPKPCTK